MEDVVIVSIVQLDGSSEAAIEHAIKQFGRH